MKIKLTLKDLKQEEPDLGEVPYVSRTILHLSLTPSQAKELKIGERVKGTFSANVSSIRLDDEQAELSLELQELTLDAPNVYEQLAEDDDEDE